MRRVVITGSGIVSCIGNNKKEVLDSSSSFSFAFLFLLFMNYLRYLADTKIF